MRGLAEPDTASGGQPHYSALAIMTALTMRAVFRVAVWQTEGLIGSLIVVPGREHRDCGILSGDGSFAEKT